MEEVVTKTNWNELSPVHGQFPHTLSVPMELNARAETIAKFDVAGIPLEIRRGREVLWVVARVKKGGVALRGLYTPDGEISVHSLLQDDDGLKIEATGSTMGSFRARLTLLDAPTLLFRWTVHLTPGEDLLIPPQPWNVYPIDAQHNPMATRGIVHATQRGTAAGVLYFTTTKPDAGTCFYLQNLTALNDYCEQTETEPDGIVGYNWPGLGYQPPPSEKRPLKRGREVSFCDAFVYLTPETPDSNRASARLFLDALAQTYPHVQVSPPKYQDWPAMAAATARDLTHSSKVAYEEHGYLYLHPYVSAEYPDSMVQLSVVQALSDYQNWLGRPLPITGRLREGVRNFYDPKLGVMRRYLATIGKDKNPDQSDSWYVYHPLVNLARLAKDGDDEAKTLFFGCTDYAIKVARHFNYEWPVMFNLVTLDVMTGDRKPDEGGQTDVPGLYAYVMLQAYDLSSDQKFVDEAVAAVKLLSDIGFAIGYQFNNVAWGVVACLKLFRITQDKFYIEQADLLLASFFHNVNLWECDLGPAKHYPTFMGVTCLADGPYMAAYEEFDAFAAFQEALDLAGDDLSRPARLLMSEYYRHALDRGWYFYPGSLPPDVLAKEVREGNGHIDRSLAIPLEDLYAGRKAPGSVGQEVYGAGMALTFLTRAYHKIDGAPFVHYCNYPVREITPDGPRAVTFRTWGEPDYPCALRLLPAGQGSVIGKVRVSMWNDDQTRKDVPPDADSPDTFTIFGGRSVTIEW